MAVLVDLSKCDRLTIGLPASVGLHSFIVSIAKVESMESDACPDGFSKRKEIARQFRSAYGLFAKLGSAILEDPKVLSLRTNILSGKLFTLSATDGSIVCRMHILVESASLHLEKFDFVQHWYAPEGFKIYSKLADLSRISECPYEPHIVAA